MIALSLCGLAFLVCYFATRKSLVAGLVSVICFGYLYGILRANFPTTFSHFIFDSGLLGFYINQPWRKETREQGRSKPIQSWVSAMIGWPLVVCFLPFQTIMITLVGLRGNILLLPMLLVGSRLKSREVKQLAVALAALNLVAIAFGVAEYFMGVPAFYPLGPATALIYRSNDVAGHQFFRIPATFTNAHAFAGAMVATIPFLLGLAMQSAQAGKTRLIGLGGVGLAVFGILLSATRMSVVVCGLLIFFVVLVGKASKGNKVIVTALIALVAWSVLSNERFTRFKTLGDTNAVSERIAGSVNRSFWEVLAEYPLGNGLGGGGTSIPYFLESELNRPVMMENEYGRILLEQGIVGLCIWVGFVVWFISRREIAFRQTSWQLGRQLGWFACVLAFAGAMIGVGLLLAVPQSLLLLLTIGWVSVRPDMDPAEDRAMHFAFRHPLHHPAYFR